MPHRCFCCCTHQKRVYRVALAQGHSVVSGSRGAPAHKQDETKLQLGSPLVRRQACFRTGYHGIRRGYLIKHRDSTTREGGKLEFQATGGRPHWSKTHETVLPTRRCQWTPSLQSHNLLPKIENTTLANMLATSTTSLATWPPRATKFESMSHYDISYGMCLCCFFQSPVCGWFGGGM